MLRQENSHKYQVPTYNVGSEGLVLQELEEILLCKGSRDSQEGQTGFLSEDLLKVVKTYLETVNVGDMRTRETSMVITKLDEALMWLNKRTQDRQERGVLNTYQK